ncbi:MAG: DUF349 domain-containing protein [Muribaculaceae bacterium]|nr:DUF349 domain-containing protein [Muribaculaceae bacterium]
MELSNKSEASQQESADVTLNSTSSNEVECDNNEVSVIEQKVSTAVGKEIMTKTEIVASLKSLLERPVEEIKDEVLQMKTLFYSIRKREIEIEKAEFLEKGNEESAFAVKEDPEENSVKELLALYKEKRIAYISNLEAIKKENLVKKQNILDTLSGLVADTDNINRHYSKFQQLQQEFKDISDVPAENVTQLWKTYQKVTEDFYDLLKINKDLRDYDFKKNLDAKEALYQSALALESETDVVLAFKKLQELHNQWRELGPVAPDIREEIWQKFKDASTQINKRYQAFFEGKKEQEKENENAKITICEKIEAMDFSSLNGYIAWEEATSSIKALQEEWKTLGFASRKVNTELFARFRKTCDQFFVTKAEFFKSLKEATANNLVRKTELCVKAEALKDSTDWKKASNEFVALQKEWKTIGPVSKKHSDSIWKRFISACDYFFEQKEKQTSNLHKEEHDNLDAKKNIISTLNDIIANSPADAVASIKEISKKWREIGHVPFKEKDKIYNEYQEALKIAFDKFDIKEVRARLSNFESSVEQLANNSDKLYRERDKLMRVLESKRNELTTYENNMTFFTVKSKAGNSMMKELERKIERIKEDIDVLEKKIEVIDTKF